MLQIMRLIGLLQHDERQNNSTFAVSDDGFLPSPPKKPHTPTPSHPPPLPFSDASIIVSMATAAQQHDGLERKATSAATHTDTDQGSQCGCCCAGKSFSVLSEAPPPRWNNQVSGTREPSNFTTESDYPVCGGQHSW